MTRKSFYKRHDIPTTQIRWRVPTQLAVDMKVVSSVTGWTEGELTTLAVLRMLETLVPTWNEQSLYIKIPELISLKAPNKPMNIKSILEEIVRVNKRR